MINDWVHLSQNQNLTGAQGAILIAKTMGDAMARAKTGDIVRAQGIGGKDGGKGVGLGIAVTATATGAIGTGGEQEIGKGVLAVTGIMKDEVFISSLLASYALSNYPYRTPIERRSIP